MKMKYKYMKIVSINQSKELFLKAYKWEIFDFKLKKLESEKIFYQGEHENIEEM